MTNAQKWVAAFLGLFLVLFFLTRLTMKDELGSAEPPMSMGGSNVENAAEQTPETLITNLGCVNCHGADLNGTTVGPSLKMVKEYWNRDALINYLRSPVSYSRDERFTKYQQEFPNVVMPSFSNVDVKELGKIADYLLNQK